MTEQARTLFDAAMERIEGPQPDGAVAIVINQGEFLSSLRMCIEKTAELDALREELGWPEYIRRYYRIVAGGPVLSPSGEPETPAVTYYVVDEAEPKTEEFNWGICCFGCETEADAQAFIDAAIAEAEHRSDRN